MTTLYDRHCTYCGNQLIESTMYFRHSPANGEKVPYVLCPDADREMFETMVMPNGMTRTAYNPQTHDMFKPRFRKTGSGSVETYWDTEGTW